MIFDGLLLLVLGMTIVFLFLFIIFISIKFLSGILFKYFLVAEDVGRPNIVTERFSKEVKSSTSGNNILPVIIAAVSYYVKKNN